MTYGKRQFENLDGVMRRLIPPFHQAMNDLLLMVDADSSAFNSYMVRGTLRDLQTTSRFTAGLAAVPCGILIIYSLYYILY